MVKRAKIDHFGNTVNFLTNIIYGIDGIDKKSKKHPENIILNSIKDGFNDIGYAVDKIPDATLYILESVFGKNDNGVRDDKTQKKAEYDSGFVKNRKTKLFDEFIGKIMKKNQKKSNDNVNVKKIERTDVESVNQKTSNDGVGNIEKTDVESVIRLFKDDLRKYTPQYKEYSSNDIYTSDIGRFIEYVTDRYNIAMTKCMSTEYEFKCINEVTKILKSTHNYIAPAYINKPLSNVDISQNGVNMLRAVDITNQLKTINGIRVELQSALDFLNDPLNDVDKHLDARRMSKIVTITDQFIMKFQEYVLEDDTFSLLSRPPYSSTKLAVISKVLTNVNDEWKSAVVECEYVVEPSVCQKTIDKMAIQNIAEYIYYKGLPTQQQVNVIENVFGEFKYNLISDYLTYLDTSKEIGVE